MRFIVSAAVMVAATMLTLAGCGAKTGAVDAGGPSDAGTHDGGGDSGSTDGGGQADAGMPASGSPDAGPDAGTSDGGLDAGHFDAGVCSTPPYPIVDARTFLDGFGVNASLTSSNVALVAAKLNELGVRRIRSELAYATLATWAALQAQMSSQGFAKPKLRFEDLIIAYNNDPATTWTSQQPDILAAADAGLLGSLEGPNEMNNVSTGNGSHGVNDLTDETDAWDGGSGNVFAWMSAIAAWKAGLTGDAAAALAAVELVAPTIASGEQSDYAQLPNLGPLVDFGDVHFYAGGGRQPSLGFGVPNAGVGYFANIYDWCQSGMTPGRPLVVSECGASTDGVQYTLHAQAAYLLNQLHEAAGIGAQRFYVYTLFDPSTGSGGSEGNFGLFDTDGTDKPVAAGFSVLKDLLSLNDSYDDPANAADTTPVSRGYSGCGLSVTGIAASGFASRVADAVVYSKSDGSTLISVTDQPALTDGSGHDITPAAVTATLHFGSPQTWKQYDPLSVTPLVPVAQGTSESVEMTLLGYPSYVLLAPPSGYTP